MKYTIPKASRRAALTLVRESDNKQWEIPLDPASVIGDEQLKREAVLRNETTYEPVVMPAPAK